MSGDQARDNENAGLKAARRLLAALEGEGCSLQARNGGLILSGASLGVGGKARAVPRDLVMVCLERDWLERDGSALKLSEAGRAWLRRLEAPGEGYAEQHQLRSMQLREIESVRRPVLVNDGESPLGWLRSRKDRNGRALISEDQFAAGERLRADYWFAQLSQRVTANWSALAPSDRSRRGGGDDAASMRDDVIAAKERVRRAIESVGPELSGVLIDICCELKGLEDAEKAQGWPQRAGKVVLQIALSRLARHYGLGARDVEGTRKRNGIRHWGAAGYRPTLDAWGGSDPQ